MPRNCAVEIALNCCKQDIFRHDLVIGQSLVRCEMRAIYWRGATTPTNMRLNMTTNLKMILSALGVAAMLASPAMAKTERHHHAAPSTVYIPSDARGAVTTYGAFRAPESPMFAPDAPTPPTYDHLGLRDFQSGPRD
jgi:hypothetical protein